MTSPFPTEALRRCPEMVTTSKYDLQKSTQFLVTRGFLRLFAIQPEPRFSINWILMLCEDFIAETLPSTNLQSGAINHCYKQTLLYLLRLFPNSTFYLLTGPFELLIWLTEVQPEIMDGDGLIPSYQEDVNNSAFFFQCDWLRCIVKLQRQMYAMTLLYSDHSACSKILGRLGGNFGVFECVHGRKFSDCAGSTFETELAEKRNTKSVPTDTNTTPDVEFLSNIENTEEFLEQLGYSYRNKAWFSHSYNTCEEYIEMRRRIEQFMDGRSLLIDSRAPAQVKCQSSSTSLSESFDCPICMESLPRKFAFSVYPFKHSVCVNCTKTLLLRWSESGDDSIQCPVCRRQFQMKTYIEGFLWYIGDDDDVSHDGSAPNKPCCSNWICKQEFL